MKHLIDEYGESLIGAIACLCILAIVFFFFFGGELLGQKLMEYGSSAL